MISGHFRGNVVDMFRDGNYHLIHGCNCFHAMGAGIAKEISTKFPGALEADLKTKSGDYFKIGSCSEYVYHDRILFNAYTQYGYGDSLNVKPIDLNDIAKCFRNAVVRLALKGDGFPLLTPKIASGFGRCTWDDVVEVVDKATGLYPVIVIEK